MANLSYDYSRTSVIVTGAARGVGLAIARRFADAGACVFLVDADEQQLLAAAAEIGGTPLVADVADTAQVERVVASVIERVGRLDIVVNNAGILRDQLVWKLTDDDWKAVVDVHLGGTFRFTRAAVRHLRAAGAGRIINVTSYTGLHGNPGQANYAAAKGGIVALTKTTAKELARFGITVNAISPNADTRMIEPDRRSQAHRGDDSDGTIRCAGRDDRRRTVLGVGGGRLHHRRRPARRWRTRDVTRDGERRRQS
jgi:3-oxoacyl-[acyl-carrier protein] reductase